MRSVYIDRRSDLKQERDGKEAKMAKELTLYRIERSPYEVEIAGLIKQVISKRLIPDDGLLLAENQHSYIQEKKEQGGIIYDEDYDITRYYLARDGSFTKRHIVRTDYWNPKVMRAYDSSLKEDETHPCNMEEIMMVTDLECDCHRDIRDSYQTYHERSTYIKDIWIESFDTIQFTRKSQNKGEGLRSILLGREKEVKEENERAKRIEEEQTRRKKEQDREEREQRKVKLTGMFLWFLCLLCVIAVAMIISYECFGPIKNVPKSLLYINNTLLKLYIAAGIAALCIGYLFATGADTNADAGVHMETVDGCMSVVVLVVAIAAALFVLLFSGYNMFLTVGGSTRSQWAFGFSRLGILAIVLVVPYLIGYLIGKRKKPGSKRKL